MHARLAVTITATEAEWEALLRAVTPCGACGAPADIVLSQRPLCVPCAAPVRRGIANTLEHATLVDRILDALRGRAA